MSSKFSVGAMNQLADAFEGENYSDEDVTKLRGILVKLKMVFAGVAIIVRVCFKLALDRALDPSSFIGGGWKFWRGPADGTGLEGDEDYIPEPDVVDFEQIVLETHLQDKEISIHGEEKMKRARASKNRQLGDKAFVALWNDWLAKRAEGKPEDSILEQLYRSGKICKVIYFFGRTLRGSGGNRYALCLCRGGDGQWDWSYDWLDDRWLANNPSVALASVETQS